MQYLNVENFIFWKGKQFLGELHKVAWKRQMFLSQNHTLHIWKILHKIILYNSGSRGSMVPCLKLSERMYQYGRFPECPGTVRQ